MFITWRDIGYSCFYEQIDLYMQFKVYSITASSIDDSKIFYGEMENLTTDYTQVTPFCKGDVKWDGCTNFEFDDETCMLHCCTKEDLTNIGVMLGRVYDLAKVDD